MKYIFSNARLPKNERLLKDIDSAAARLHDKLISLDVKSQDISDYSMKYLINKIESLDTNLQLYSYILSWSLANFKGSYREFTLCDYGGGTGILSLMAKEFGIGKVIYNDIYDVSCQDAEKIGKSIGNMADHYVQGDIDDVIRFLGNNNMYCDAIASYDVIEHIYDIEEFFDKIFNLSKDRLTLVMSSGANKYNPRINSRITREQIETENVDRKKEKGHKERDCVRSFLNVRKEMIENYLNTLGKNLTVGEIERLARNTRGKVEIGIKRAVDDYLVKGTICTPLNHPTNTCDPYTGNWIEKLMDPYSLKNILLKKGCKAEIMNGYYGRPKNLIKRSIGNILNLLISIFSKQGIRIAPFFTIHAEKI